MQIFQQEISRMRDKKGEGFTQANIQKHGVCGRHFQEYLKKYYRREDAVLTDINRKMIEGFRDYLRTDCDNNHNTTMNLLAILKKMYKIALDNRWVEHNPFNGIKLGLKEVNREFLEQDEIDAIAYRDFKIERLNLVRDYFIFSCYTGLAYIDLMTLTRGTWVESG